jgi:hypothetical protein
MVFGLEILRYFNFWNVDLHLDHVGVIVVMINGVLKRVAYCKAPMSIVMIVRGMLFASSLPPRARLLTIATSSGNILVARVQLCILIIMDAITCNGMLLVDFVEKELLSHILTLVCDNYSHLLRYLFIPDLVE